MKYEETLLESTQHLTPAKIIKFWRKGSLESKCITEDMNKSDWDNYSIHLKYPSF